MAGDQQRQLFGFGLREQGRQVVEPAGSPRAKAIGAGHEEAIGLDREGSQRRVERGPYVIVGVVTKPSLHGVRGRGD